MGPHCPHQISHHQRNAFLRWREGGGQSTRLQARIHHVHTADSTPLPALSRIFIEVNNMGLDPKVKNMIKFMTQNLIIPLTVIIIVIRAIGITDYFRLFGQATLAFLFYRIGLQFYRRVIMKPKDYRKMGKWAIVTGRKAIRSYRDSHCLIFIA